MDRDTSVCLANVLKVAEQTIGFDLAEVRPDSEADEKKAKQLADSMRSLRKLRDHEHIVEAYNSRSGWKYEIEEDRISIDPDKDWKTALTSDDWKKLSECGVTLSALESDIEGGTRVGLSDWKNVLIIRTPDYTWTNLCGREWHYDLDTKEFNLYCMS